MHNLKTCSNNLHVSFKKFVENTTNNQLLQYVGGVVDTNSTQIIKVVPNYILK